MGLKTPEEFVQSLADLHLQIYLFGEKVDDYVNHPVIRPSINCIAMTYELARQPEYEDLMLATSHLTGKKVNRFAHIHQSTDDLAKKVKMQRLLGQKTGSCFQRCVGHGRDQRPLLGHLRDRSGQGHRLPRALQEVRTAPAGRGPRGGRGHDRPQGRPQRSRRISSPTPTCTCTSSRSATTASSCAAPRLTRPAPATRTRSSSCRRWPCARATRTSRSASPARPTPRACTYIYGRQSCDTRKLEDNDLDVGNAQFGGQEALMVFDDVFVPWDRVFMCGEIEFSGALVERFAGFHRQSYGGCKVGVGDVLIGAAALAADMNGVPKASHIKDKLIEMTHLNETLFSCGLACSYEGVKMPAGNYQIDMLLANVCKQNVTRFPYEIARLAEDIAGGLMVTMPSAQDLADEKIGPIVEKFLVGQCDTPDDRPHARAAPHREHDARRGRRRLPDRVDARRRLAAGAAHHDRAPVATWTTRRSWPRRWPASASRGTRRRPRGQPPSPDAPRDDGRGPGAARGRHRPVLRRLQSAYRPGRGRGRGPAERRRTPAGHPLSLGVPARVRLAASTDRRRHDAAVVAGAHVEGVPTEPGEIASAVRAKLKE